MACGAFNAATFTATAILPQMQGAMSATQDEISWTVTFNILATAVFTPMTGWLVGRFGRGPVQFWSLVSFSAATLMCGLSQSLETLVFWRTVQGASGAPLLPLGQAILLDVFPRRQHGFVISIFGVANTFGPIIGPVLAGYLAESYSWRWGYYMILPVSIAATIASHFAIPRERPGTAAPLDWTGFLALSVAIASMQLLLSRGQRLDWFESSEILIEALVAVAALYVFVAHSLTARHPFLSPRLVQDRNYAVGMFLIVIFGMLNFTPMVLLPPLLQNQLGFPDGLVGYVVSWRGVGVMSGFFLSMLTTGLDPRIGMVTGFGIQIISGLWLTSIDFNVQLSTLCANAFLQGLAVGMIWTPISTSAFWTLDSQPARRRRCRLPSHAQHRQQFLHLGLRRRGGARDGRQLQPDDGVPLALQPHAVAALGDGDVDGRHHDGAGGAGARDQQAGRDDRLPERLLDVHGGLRDRPPARLHRPPPEGVELW